MTDRPERAKPRATAVVRCPDGHALPFSAASARTESTARSKARQRFLNATGFSDAEYQRLGFRAEVTAQPLD